MKINKLLLLVAASSMLAGCDFPGGGEEEDPTLYHLTLSYSSNVASKEGFSNDKLIAELAFGENGELERDEEDIEALKKAGATDEDIAKAGVRQADGSYYFFSQDPMFIRAPEVDGYALVGLFYKGTDKLAYRPGVHEGHEARWNMDDKNVEVEARYIVVNYDVTYCYASEFSDGPSGVMPSGSHSNPAKYNYETDGVVTLTAPTATFEGYEFDHWSYDNHTPGGATIESLPYVYDDNVLHGTWGQASLEIPPFVVFANYKKQTVTPTVVVKCGEEVIHSLDEYIEIFVGYEESVTLAEYEVKSYDYGTTLGVWAHDGDFLAYALEGIYIDGVKIPDVDLGGGSSRPSNRFDYHALTGDAAVEIKVTPVPCELSLDIRNADVAVESLTIKGEATKVDGVLATEEIDLLTAESIEVQVSTSFVIKVKLNEGYAVDSNENFHSLDYVPAEPVADGDYITFTFTPTNVYATLYLYFVVAE